MHSTRRESIYLTNFGATLSPVQAERLEVTVSNPLSLEPRVKLLGFYSEKSMFSVRYRNNWYEHIFWLIENHPHHKVLALPRAVPYFDKADAPMFEMGAKLWDEQIEKYPNDATIRAHAANYYTCHNIHKKVEMLEKAIELDPSNPEWKDDLGFACLLGATPQKNDPLRRRLRTFGEDYCSCTTDQCGELSYRLFQFTKMQNTTQTVSAVSNCVDFRTAESAELSLLRLIKSAASPLMTALEKSK